MNASTRTAAAGAHGTMGAALTDPSLNDAGKECLSAVAHSIAGIGVDAVDVDRFRAILARCPGFAARYFTALEDADALRSDDPTESLAARFAAKEAVMK